MRGIQYGTIYELLFLIFRQDLLDTAHKARYVGRKKLVMITQGHAVHANIRCRFKCTNSNDKAAGVTPEIRPAWATVVGRTLVSF